MANISSEQEFTTDRTMVAERLVRPQLWLLIVLGLAGLFFFFCKFNESFPTASLDLKLSRKQIAEQARLWSSKLDYNPEKTVNSTIFTYDDGGKTFLEYELGQSKANALMRDVIPIWSWSTRFCRPAEMEELQVGLATNGQLAYFRHSYPNDLPLPSVSHVEAQQLAREFVEKNIGASLAGTKLIKDSQEKQVKRSDHAFTFEDEAREFKGARLRTYIYVAGNKVSEYTKYLHVPEKFERKYAEIRSYNDLLKSISSIVYTALASAISFIFVWAFASGRVRWKLAIFAGIVGCLLSMLSFLDGLPTLISAYPTTMSFNQYMQDRGFSAVISAIFAGFSALVFIGALEPIYRLAFPEQIALEKICSADGLRTKPIFQGVLAGLAVFGLHSAYVVAFYLLGQHVGFWSPLEVRETGILSGLMPVYSAIEVGISAATMEEMMYRVLCLFAFRKLFKSFWLANLLQAAAWAFMHSDYPQEPAYARGIELTIGGFFYGYILKRYGLLSCVLAHYTYDAFLGVTPLLSSNLLSDKLSALVAVAPGLLALIASIWFLKRKGPLSDIEPLTNANIPIKVRAAQMESAEPGQPFVYRPLSRKAIAFTVLACLVFSAGFICLPLKTIGANNVVTITRSQAIHDAREYLLQQGINTAGFSALAWLSDESDDMSLQYVLEKEKFARTAELAESCEPRLVWRVRLFKTLDPHQHYVTLTGAGKPVTEAEVLEEDAPGAKLDELEARAAVEKFLHAQHPEYEPFLFDNASRHERLHRTDYDFTYKVPRLKAGEADFKIYVGTVGSTVSNFGRAWQIPDNWTFERNKIKLKDHVFGFLRKAMYAILAILAVLWAIDILRAGTIRWRLPIILGAISGSIVLLTQLNTLPVVMYGYRTDVALSTFIVGQVVELVKSVFSAAASMGLLSAFALGAYRQCAANPKLSALLEAVLPGRSADADTRRSMWFDGLLCGYGFALLLGAVAYIFDAAQFQVSPAVHMLSLDGIRSMGDEWSPAIGALLGAVSAALAVLVAAPCSVSVARKYFRGRFWPCITAVLVISAILNSSCRYWQDFAWNVASTVAIGLLAYLFVSKLARTNPIAYLSAGFSTAIGGALYSMGKHALPLFAAYAGMLLFLLLLPWFYTAYLYLRARLAARAPEMVPVPVVIPQDADT